MLLNAKKVQRIGRDKMIKTFRGLLADGAQDQIRLGTIKGKVGYKIVKFESIPNQPFDVTQESITKIYKTNQSTIDGIVDFTDNDLLAVAIFKDHATTFYNAYDSVIFDGEIFNQDVYVTHSEVAGSASQNYYIELEVIPLSEQGAEYTTIKDIRTNS